MSSRLTGALLVIGFVLGCTSTPKAGEGETLITITPEFDYIYVVYIDGEMQDLPYNTAGKTSKYVVPNGRHYLYILDGRSLDRYSEAIVFNADSKELRFSVSLKGTRQLLLADKDSQSSVITVVDNPKGWGNVTGKWHAEVTDGRTDAMLFLVFRDDGIGVVFLYDTSNEEVQFPGGMNKPVYDRRDVGYGGAFTYTSSLEYGLTIIGEDETGAEKRWNMPYKRLYDSNDTPKRRLHIDNWLGEGNNIEFEKDYRWNDPRDNVGPVLIGVRDMNMPYPGKETIVYMGKEITMDETYNRRLKARETLPPSLVDTFISDLSLNGGGTLTNKEYVLAVLNKYLPVVFPSDLIGYRQWNHANFIGFVAQAGVLDQLAQDVVDYVTRNGIRAAE